MLEIKLDELSKAYYLLTGNMLEHSTHVFISIRDDRGNTTHFSIDDIKRDNIGINGLIEHEEI